MLSEAMLDLGVDQRERWTSPLAPGASSSRRSPPAREMEAEASPLNARPRELSPADCGPKNGFVIRCVRWRNRGLAPARNGLSAANLRAFAKREGRAGLDVVVWG